MDYENAYYSALRLLKKAEADADKWMQRFLAAFEGGRLDAFKEAADLLRANGCAHGSPRSQCDCAERLAEMLVPLRFPTVKDGGES